MPESRRHLVRSPKSQAIVDAAIAISNVGSLAWRQPGLARAMGATAR